METVCDNKTSNRHHNVLCVLAHSCKHNYNLGTQEQREEEQKQSNSTFRPQYSTGHPISEKKNQPINLKKQTNKNMLK